MRALSIPQVLPSLRPANEPMVSLAGVPQLDAAVLSRLVRLHGAAAAGGRRVKVVDAAPEVAAALRALGLAWMLAPRPFASLAPANEPMDRAAA